MKKLVLFSLVPVLLAVTSASATTPHLVDVDVDFPAHGIFRTTLVFQEGPNPLNRFTMQRVRKVALVHPRPGLMQISDPSSICTLQKFASFCSHPCAMNG